MNKDFSKLRPFDPEAAKAGDKFLWIDNECEFLGIAKHAGKPGEILLRVEHDQGLSYVYPQETKEAPLAWVRKSADEDILWPVYKGDSLYWEDDDGVTKTHIADSFKENDFGYSIYQESGKSEDKGWVTVERLRFTPPKPKLRHIKMLCYFTGAVLTWHIEDSQPGIGWKRVPAEDKIIEVEE